MTNIFRFLLNTTLNLAIIAVGMTIFAYSIYGISIDYSMLIAVFCITFTVYCTDRLVGLQEDEKNNYAKRVSFVSKHKTVLTVAVIGAFLISIILVFFKNLYALPIILLPPAVGVLYSVKFGNFRLKNITGIKNVTIGVAWACIGSLIPLTTSIPNPILVVYIFYFIFISFVTDSALGDVYDVEGDRKNDVKTIPVRFGLEKTLQILLFANITLIPATILAHESLTIFAFPLLIIILCKILRTVYIFNEKRPSVETVEIISTSEFIYMGLLFFLIRYLM